MNDVSKWNEIADIFLLALNKYIEVRLGCTVPICVQISAARTVHPRLLRSRLGLAPDRAAADRDGYVRQARRGSAHAPQDSQPKIRRLQSLLESAPQTPRPPRPLKLNTGLDVELLAALQDVNAHCRSSGCSDGMSCQVVCQFFMYIGRWLESIPKLEELLKSTPYDPKAVLSLLLRDRLHCCASC